MATVERLTQKQEDFCLAYFELKNASRAGLVAGYSPKTAGVIGRENLLKPAIQARLAELRQAAQSAKVMPVLERKERLSEIGRGVITDHVGGNGREVEIDTKKAGSIAEIVSRTEFYKGGEEGHAEIIKLKLHNPINAIAELNKMEGVYEADRSPQQAVSTFIFILPDGTRLSPRQMLTTGAGSGGEGADAGIIEGEVKEIA